VKQHCRTGSIFFANPRWLSLGGDSHGEPGPVYLVLQLLPQYIAVNFACNSVARVLPIFHREWPNDLRPDELFIVVRDWLNGSGTKQRVQKLLKGDGVLSNKDNTEPAHGAEVKFINRRGAALCVARAVDHVAAATTYAPSSGKWIPEVCFALVEAIEASDDKTDEKEYYRKELLHVLSATSDIS